MALFQPKAIATDKKFVSIAQANFSKGYISTLSESRMPIDGLADMTNMWLEQDSVPRPRPPFKPYGSAYLGPCIGEGTYTVNNSGIPQYWEISMQQIPVNDVQTLTITGTPTGGTFTLTFGGKTTSAIAYNALASAVQTALVALSSIGTGNVVCTGGPLPGTGVVITFQGALANANVGAITFANSLTGGSTPTCVITHTTTGGPVARVCTRKDGGNWTQVTSGAPVYNLTAWTTFTPGAAINSAGVQDRRVYISNGINAMSYYDITGNNIVQYTGLSTPSAPTVTQTGNTGSNFTQYYVITANNAGGESASSTAGSVTIQNERGFWTSSMYCSISWGAVSGATSYSIYTGDINGQFYWLATVSGLSFTDTGNVATNIYKQSPTNDSSAGPTVTTLVNIDNQLFGCGDPVNPQYLWYSGQAYHFGDFSFNPQGGGYALIDYGGDTIPTTPFGFQDGKGNPVVSILTYGQAGRGKLLHFTTATATVGSTSITYPNIYEASSKDGSPAPRGVAIYNNAAYYCTGIQFKTTGIKPSVINILSTDTIANQMLPDLARLNLAALGQMCALEYLGKVYFAVPTGSSTTNNEIWILDLTRGGLWILKWPVNVQHMWLYEDNSGNPHLMTLQNGVQLELDLDRTSTPTQDNGVPFSTRLGSGSMVFDKGGVAMFSSYFTYFKFLYPLGNINASIYAVTEDDNTNTLVVSDKVDVATNQSRLGWGQMTWSNPSAKLPTTWSAPNVGPVIETATNTSVLPLEVDNIVNEQSWVITTNTSGCDYLLSSATTTGYTIPKLYSGQ